MMTLMSLVHSASLSFVRRTTSIFCYDFDVLSTFCKFQQVRWRTKFCHYEALDNSIFQKLLGTAEIAGFMMIAISAVHFANLTVVSRAHMSR